MVDYLEELITPGVDSSLAYAYKVDMREVRLAGKTSSK